MGGMLLAVAHFTFFHKISAICLLNNALMHVLLAGFRWLAHIMRNMSAFHGVAIEIQK
tara:strand:+ start:2105 stop:2278 length:174 start_codon:yes stop_codon:yes gene_type:complete